MPRVNRRRAKVDANQPEIVKSLREIPGVTVQLGMDDFLIGYKGKTYWIELKDVGKEKQLKDSQIKLLDKWTGHYMVTSSLDEILSELGINKTNAT